MEKRNCIIMDDNIIELLNEVEQQMKKGIVCCKCQNPCNKEGIKSSRCSLSMKNLLVDIGLFKDAYEEFNKITERIDENEQT